MNRYRIVKKGAFESHNKFEERINSMVLEGYKAISISHQGYQMVVLMEKV